MKQSISIISPFESPKELSERSFLRTELDTPPSLSSDTLQDDEETSAYDDKHEPPAPKISLGPKMRIHSPAPWELDEDASQLDKPEFHQPFLSPKKPFPFAIAKSLESGRTSGESFRSQIKTKQSFETSSSQASFSRGRLYSLSRDNLSTSSLGSGQHVSRGRPSLNIFRTKSPQTPTIPFEPLPSSRSFTDPSFFRVRDSSYVPSSHRSTYVVDDFHPYANPDLVKSSLKDESQVQELSRGTSKSSVVSSVSASSSLHILKSPTNTRRRSSALQPHYKLKKDISSPVDLRVDGITLRAWKDRRLPFPMKEVVDKDDLVAPFSLISLEEARAQRSPGTTADSALLNTTTATRDGHTSFGGCDHNVWRPESRPRSISTSARTPSPSRSMASTVSVTSKLTRKVSPGETLLKDGNGGKALKHRKSSFLKMFNNRTIDNDFPLPELPSSSLLQCSPEKDLRDQHLTLQLQNTQSSQEMLLSEDVQVSAPVDSGQRTASSLSVQLQTDSPSSSDEQEPSTASSSTVVSQLPTLSLRPVSTIFSAQFTEHLLSPGTTTICANEDFCSPQVTELSSPNGGSHPSKNNQRVRKVSESHTSVVLQLQEQVLAERSKRLTYQRQRLELEERVNELEAELTALRVSRNSNGRCIACGANRTPVSNTVRCKKDSVGPEKDIPGILRRPRAKTEELLPHVG